MTGVIADEAAPTVPVTHIRPSLLAALDVVIKVVGVLLVFGLSIVLPLIASGDTVVGAIGGILVASFGGPFVIPAIIGAFFPAIQLAFTTYTVDDEGIHVRTQILQKNERRVQWEKVTAVMHRRTIIDRLLGIERLDVVAYGARGTTMHLVGLRDAPRLRDIASERMRHAANLGALWRSD